jgi:xanthosine utilization system XapX-like protein
MWLYLLVYFMGLVAGVIAHVWLDVRLRKPALSRQIVLLALGVIVGVVIYQWSTEPEFWIMYGLWASTGVLAGLGSRESREPLG